MSRLLNYGWGGDGGGNSVLRVIALGGLVAAFYFGYLKEDISLGFVLGAFGALLFVLDANSQVDAMRRSKRLSADLVEKDNIYREIEDARKEIHARIEEVVKDTGARISSEMRNAEERVDAIEAHIGHMSNEIDRRCSRKECLREMAGN